MKIFWRIFMRQISLTDYFCKGLKENVENKKNSLLEKRFNGNAGISHTFSIYLSSL
ncbi:hypothetical protein NMH_1867 [Neisseria meningitidis H44/76]|uniref:Uncharacterized protein n=2 Tax=Neisseria meningitidis serogroup B TaxID=491 RepID=A0A0H5QB37_NEIMI|nr:hypothetical protein NMH_1867 [Neisseria meningitidis H44/76]CRY99262.1 hypothetical protein [Neisseria meningitidis serogroup B]